MLPYLRQARLAHRDARLLLLSHFLIGLSYSGIYVVLFNLYLLRLGYGTQFIGLVNGIAVMVHALFCLPAGMLGGRWGARRTIVIGALIAGVGLAVAPLGEFLPSAWQSAWLMTAFTFAWIGASFYLVNHTPFLISVTASDARNHIFSLSAALLGVATFLGSLCGGLMPGLFATLLQRPVEASAVYRYPLLIAGLLFLLAVPVLLQTGDRPTLQGEVKESVPRRAPYLLIALLAVAALLRVTSEGAGKTFFNVYLDAALHVPTAYIGMVVAGGQILSIPAALFMPLLVQRWGRAGAIILATAGMALSLLLLALSGHWLSAGGAYMSLIALGAIARPAFLVYSQEAVPAGWRSTMSGAVAMANGLSLGGMAIGGGYLIAGMGYPMLFGLGATLAAAGACFFALSLTGAVRRLRPIAPA